MLKILLAFSAAALPVSPANPQTAPGWEWAIDTSPAVTETGIDPSLHPEVVRVDCIPGRGTAFRVGPRTLISVAHVTSLGGCAINGVPITVIETKGDFSVLLTNDVSDKWLRIDCGGFVKGRPYTAIGFARGLPVQTTVDVVATGDDLSGFARLWGVFTVIPGQSGGPIIDAESGKVVGTVNVYDAQRGNSGSMALKNSPVCQS